MSDLHLHVTFEHFDAIQSGEKHFEYRLFEKWRDKLEKKQYENVVIWKGYTSEKITFPWHGYVVREITHKHFGAEPVKVFAIRLARSEMSNERR